MFPFCNSCSPFVVVSFAVHVLLPRGPLTHDWPLNFIFLEKSIQSLFHSEMQPTFGFALTITLDLQIFAARPLFPVLHESLVSFPPLHGVHSQMYIPSSTFPKKRCMGVKGTLWRYCVSGNISAVHSLLITQCIEHRESVDVLRILKISLLASLVKAVWSTAVLSLELCRETALCPSQKICSIPSPLHHH